jgi:hypothetical protein
VFWDRSVSRLVDDALAAERALLGDWLRAKGASGLRSPCSTVPRPKPTPI